MGQNDRRTRWISILLGVALMAAGCGKAPAQDMGQVENSNVTASELEKNEAEHTEDVPVVETGFPSRMPSFTAKDLDGNTVTQDIFGEKDLTVVNIWGTF